MVQQVCAHFIWVSLDQTYFFKDLCAIIKVILCLIRDCYYSSKFTGLLDEEMSASM